MSSLFRKLEKWLAPAWAVVILVVSVMPTSDINVESNMLFTHADKVVHFIVYFALQFLCLRNQIVSDYFKNKWIIFFGVVTYGVVIELIQGYFLVDRFFEYYDIIANITGALMGNLFFNRIKS